MWMTKKLREICENIKKEKAHTGEIPYIEIGNIDVNSKKIIFTEKGAVAGSIYAPANSILISRVRPTRGAIAFIDKKIAVSSAFTILKPKPECSSKLLFYFLAWNEKFFEYLEKRQKGTNYPSVREKDVLEFEISLPNSKEDQQKIVKILDTIQEAVEIQEKIIEKTKELKKSLMAELFKYGAPSFRRGRKLKKTEIGEIPEDWEVVRIKDIVLDIEQNDPSKTPLQEIKYIDVSSISNEFLKIVEYKSYLGKDAPSRARKILKENDIVFATVRPYLKRIAFVPKEYDGFYGSTAFCVLRSNPEKILPYFLFYYVSTDIFVSKVSGYQTGSGYPAITEDHIKNELIPLPSLSEQQEIAEILQTIDQKIEIEKKKKELYEELFKTMLNKIMNQEIDVEKIEV
jgi:type I restriction enzyme S subunit